MRRTLGVPRSLRRRRHRSEGDPPPRCWVERAGPDRCVVALRGDWDVTNSERLGALLDQVAEGGYALVVLDLEQVTFADSTVLALAIAAQAKLHATGGQLRIVGATPALAVLLEATGLRGELPVYRSRGEALRLPQSA
jgi:anti-sigma B factor antagonist